MRSRPTRRGVASTHEHINCQVVPTVADKDTSSVLILLELEIRST